MAFNKKIKKTKRQLSAAVAHVKSSFNNTIVTITTPKVMLYYPTALES